ncbi:MAG: hypothetical protein NC453_16895 [Muribaculum sp.]|nr:hypothetical protein [Muribaculum sp.]
MTSKEVVIQTLEKWRFPILQEAENAIVIRYQLNYVQIGSLQDDTHAIAVTLTGVFSADDESEARLALKTCNELNYRMMQIKLYLDEDNDLVIASEFFYKDDEDVELLLNYALQAVMTAKKRFIQQYKAVVDEDKLIQEINNE